MLSPTLDHERQLTAQGYLAIAGVDEVGRGCWAGPVVVGAVVLPIDSQLYSPTLSISQRVVLPRWLRDSKKLSPAQRVEAAGQLRELAVAWAIGRAESQEIDEVGISQATFLAMERAINGLSLKVDYLLVDGLAYPKFPLDQQLAIAKADATIASVAAASILAKVYRDQLMSVAATQYPEYGFEHHKGYGTALHQKAIGQYGLSPLHRRSFRMASSVKG